MRAQDDEEAARASMKVVLPCGMQAGENKWDDWSFFAGYLAHKSRMSEITVWSGATVHGVQCAFQRDGQKKGQKADKHANDLGKAMPNGNAQMFKDNEEITELHFIVSETQCKGVIGQIRLKTCCFNADGTAGEVQEYKFGRTTDGRERSHITPPGHRLLCLSGSHNDGGLRELGVVFVPKMDRVKDIVGGATLTLCGRTRISIGLGDGRILALDSQMRLGAMPLQGAALLDSILVLDGEGDRFALRTRNKGQYLALRPDRTIGCRMAGWGGFSDEEVFEIVVEETDHGDRVSIRASNGKFLGADPTTGLIIAGLAEVREDQLLKIIPRSSIQLPPSLAPATSLRVGVRTNSEREVISAMQFRDRTRKLKKDLANALLLQLGIRKMTELASHVWTCENPRALMELPALLAGGGGEWVTVHLTNLLRNLFYCSAVASVGALNLLQATMMEHPRLVEHACHELPHSDNPDEQPAAMAEGVVKLSKFITDQGPELSRGPDTFLWRLLKHPMPRSLGKALQADIERVKSSVTEAVKLAATVKPDLVLLVGAKRRLEALRDTGAIKAMDLMDQCLELERALDDKIRALRSKSDEVIASFAETYMRTIPEKSTNSRNKVCSAHSFELMADALYRARDEVPAPASSFCLAQLFSWCQLLCSNDCGVRLTSCGMPANCATGRGLRGLDRSP